jgi:uncharacterized damage-inducible protein DinB
LAKKWLNWSVEKKYLAGEGKFKPGGAGEGEGWPYPGEPGSLADLLQRFYKQVDIALEQLAATPESTLTEPRSVGRAQIPSTVGGLLFHAAEHTQRHTGQLLVTVRVLLQLYSGNPCEQSGV